MAYDNQRSFEEKHAEELGVKSYTFEILKGFIPLITAGVGGYIGYKSHGLVGKLFPKLEGVTQRTTDKVTEKVGVGKGAVTISKKWSETQNVGAGAGGVVGLLVGSIPLGYREWRKNESARLAAREINEDISNMRIVQRPDEELLAENSRLRDMLMKSEGADTPKSHIESASASYDEHITERSHEISQ